MNLSRQATLDRREGSTRALRLGRFSGAFDSQTSGNAFKKKSVRKNANKKENKSKRNREKVLRCLASHLQKEITPSATFLNFGV